MAKILKQINKLILENDENSVKTIIGKFIIDNIDFVIKNDTKTIAKECNVSAATIIRLCKYLNLDGINELKYQLKNIKVSVPYNDFQTNQHDKYLKIREHGSNQLIYNFNTYKENILEWFNKGNNIYFFCFNVAFYATKNFVQRARAKGYKLFIEDDMSSIEWYIEHIKPQDRIIFISLSGNNYLLETSAKKVSKKAKIAAILGENSSFTKYVDYYFLLENNEDELWELFSIRSQLLQQLLDFILIEL